VRKGEVTVQAEIRTWAGRGRDPRVKSIQQVAELSGGIWTVLDSMGFFEPTGIACQRIPELKRRKQLRLMLVRRTGHTRHIDG
jgi:hypothetical protein